MCSGGEVKNLCEQTANLNSCDTYTQHDDFKGRVSYVDPGTIKVTNMMKRDNGLVSCWRPKGAARKYLYEANFIGIFYKQYNQYDQTTVTSKKSVFSTEHTLEDDLVQNNVSFFIKVHHIA